MLKDIILELDYEENLHTAKKYTSDFSFRCRFIGNYLRRQSKQIKFESSSYNRLFISACEFSPPATNIWEKTLRVYVQFDKTEYDSLANAQLPDFFSNLYKKGIIKASETHNIPIEFLLQELDRLKNNQYLNQWEFKSKSFKDLGVKASLICTMTMDTFYLTFVIKKKDEVLLAKEILQTLPDEIIFHWQFKDIVLNSGTIKVMNEFKEPIYSIDAQSLIRI
jgi:hypothetical protein